jgi:hypothetical protein
MLQRIEDIAEEYYMFKHLKYKETRICFIKLVVSGSIINKIVSKDSNGNCDCCFDNLPNCEKYEIDNMFICMYCYWGIEKRTKKHKNREITRRLLVAELPIIADICAEINARIFALLKD